MSTTINVNIKLAESFVKHALEDFTPEQQNTFVSMITEQYGNGISDFLEYCKDPYKYSFKGYKIGDIATIDVQCHYGTNLQYYKDKVTLIKIEDKEYFKAVIEDFRFSSGGIEALIQPHNEDKGDLKGVSSYYLYSKNLL